MKEPDAVKPGHRPKILLPGRIFAGVLMLAVAGLSLVQFSRERQRRGFPHPLISEIQAANRDGLRDENGHVAGWIELWNPTGEPINLKGWSLTDDFRRLHKWSFPDVLLGPGEFRVVFATGKNRTAGGAPLHTNFRLNPDGEYLALVAPRGDRVVQEFLPRYPRQIADATFGLSPEVFSRGTAISRVAPSDLAFLLTPTPGAPNTDELLGVVDDLRFSRPRGPCQEDFRLSIDTRTQGVEIRYTVDGTLPTAAHGSIYRTPLPITRTTVIRAAAFRPGYKPSSVGTATYLFPEQVIRQTGAGFPKTWGTRNDQPVPADYEMDPEVLKTKAERAAAVEGLDSLATVSLVLPPEDLFDGARGLYSHPLEHGEAWERAGVFEWMDPADGSNAHAECGVRIQGGWSRRPEESPKHSFRLIFRREYGAPAFKHRLFGGGSKTFHELILRAGCNNSWLHWSSAERRRGDLLRDEWMRDTLGLLGAPAARGAFVHLYLNGLYWGIYNLVERPDANFLAEHFGGAVRDYDSRNADHVIAGDTTAWDRLFALANAGVTTPEAYARIGEVLDVPAFIDFMIVHLYGGSADMDRASNWYAARLRRSGGRYVFIMWDGERTLEDPQASSLAMDDDQCPTRLFQRLRVNAEFRGAFSRRVKELTATGGALSPGEAAGRYRALATRLEAAMICESARWGDYRRDVHPYKEGPYELYTVDGHWKPEVRRLLQEFFPRRTGVFLAQLRQAGLLAD